MAKRNGHAVSARHASQGQTPRREGTMFGRFKLSNTGKGLIAYVNSVNDRGGINGRKISLITYDDAYSPPKYVINSSKAR
jgi:hypothetical protein